MLDTCVCACVLHHRYCWDDAKIKSGICVGMLFVAKLFVQLFVQLIVQQFSLVKTRGFNGNRTGRQIGERFP